ncbi:MAG: TRAP transporter large permease [Deltaproteobacteria bacterium]|nr:TRAP transporter large permease [Deltaproteobacteria bacterium]
MEPITTGWLMILLVFCLLVLGLPVAFAMFIAGAIGHIIVVGYMQAIFSIPIVFYENMSRGVLVVVPIFVLMGMFAWKSGLADDAFEAAQKWVSSIPGGLAQATILAGAAFAAACGTTIASCAALGKICVPAMRKAGVDEKLGLGAVAATAALSVMIPPSIIMPIYAVITEQSVGKLLIAGILPGVVATLIFMIQIFIMVKRKPQLVPAMTGVSWRERLLSLRKVWGIVLLFFIVMGGIYSGIVTPNEAASVGAFGALLIGLSTRRLKWKEGVLSSLRDTASITCSVLILTVCALYFSHFLVLSRLPTEVTQYITNLSAPPLAILVGILLIYTFLGCILDSLSMILLTMPIVYPAILRLGYDPIWFGVIIVMMVELAALTPPFGINLFVLKSAVPDAEMKTIIQAVFPFIIADFIIIAIYVAFPQIALFLPNMMTKDVLR